MRATTPLFTSILAATLSLTGFGCASDADTSGESGDLAEVVLPGKADNYLSPASREYAVWGIGELTLEAEWADRTADERAAEVDELLDMRFKAYSHFINEYVKSKTRKDANYNYGGFYGLIHGSTLEFVADPITDDGLNWAFIWEIEMGGPQDLLDQLPLERDAEGNPYFITIVPRLDASALRTESYPKKFDPAQWDGDIEELQVRIDAKEASIDSFPGYNELAEDGLIDILIVVGGDYNDKRYDLLAAESHFDWLKSAGFAHPASDWEELTLESAPFTKTVSMNGRDVKVEITLVHPGIVEVAELDSLREVIIDGYQTKDIVMYDGHAGQDPDYSGVVYHYKPRHAITATDLGKLDLPEDYQIYVFNGCKTYNVYPESVYAHPDKTGDNLDTISTVSFSWLSQQTFTTSGFLTELLSLDEQAHVPQTWNQILSRMNSRNNDDVYYGVHGIDDNSKLNPYADVSTLCGSCSANSDCPGSGNLCLALGDGVQACGAQCTDDVGCPSGYSCMDIAQTGQISGSQCVPQSLSCR